jgi:hypothetical protein
MAAIFYRTDLIYKKKGQMPIANLKDLVANGDLAAGNFAPCLSLLISSYIQVVRARGIKILAYVIIPTSFMKFMVSKVYSVIQIDFHAAHQYISMWAPALSQRNIEAVERIIPFCISLALIFSI